jgi:predicted O-linked N-acetylglucosamine transferase (SPINDLY family)
MMALWAEILKAVPNSRLTLKYNGLGDSALQKKVRATFAEHDIEPGRLDLLGYSPSQREHLEHYNSIDIGLDTFPYNGTTTTCDALWMGVPVVTLAGKAHAGRVGVSQMTNLGLTDLIAHSPEEYVSIAVRLATDRERLAALRSELRSRLAASPLMNAPRLTSNLEQAYRTMWEKWCQAKSAG